jgi:hypothetical protein
MVVSKGERTTLMLDNIFETTAGQTYSYVLLGERAGFIAPDETITVEVPISEMNGLLTYSSSWHDAPGSTGLTGSQPYPAVALRLKTVLGGVLDLLTAGLTGATDLDRFSASDNKLVVSGDNGSTCKSLVAQFQQIDGFTYHDANGASDYLAAIPVEAIQSFSVSEVITDSIATVVGDLVAIPTPGSTGVEAGLTGAIQSLFEQAVSAGLVTAGETATADLQTSTISHPSYATLGAVEAATVAGTSLPVYGVQWGPGQSLGFYVRFALSKTRKFTLSNDVTGSAMAAATISFGGVEFDVAGDHESSTPVSKVYQIVLRTPGEALAAEAEP